MINQITYLCLDVQDNSIAVIINEYLICGKLRTDSSDYTRFNTKWWKGFCYNLILLNAIQWLAFCIFIYTSCAWTGIWLNADGFVYACYGQAVGVVSLSDILVSTMYYTASGRIYESIQSEHVAPRKVNMSIYTMLYIPTTFIKHVHY